MSKDKTSIMTGAKRASELSEEGSGDSHSFEFDDTIFPEDVSLPDTSSSQHPLLQTEVISRGEDPPSLSDAVSVRRDLGKLEHISKQQDLPISERLLRFNALGSGGMGEVYRAFDKIFNRAVAMKVLHEKAYQRKALRARFVREAHITAQLAHPCIPPIHELGFLEDGRPFFTMKVVLGKTLAQINQEVLTKQSIALSEQKRLEVFQKVCEAMAYAHSRGVLHCDLKPSNIMVGAFGEVMVMDWGLAQLLRVGRSEFDGESDTDDAQVYSRPARSKEPAVRTIDLTEAEEDVLAGTPAYMSPEHAVYGMKDLGPQTDVFALGLILYELLAGELPELGSHIQQLQKAHETFVLPLPDNSPSKLFEDHALLTILRNSLAPAREHRYADARELAEDLASWREGALRREKALVFVRQARSTMPMVEATQDQAEAVHEAAAELLSKVGVGAGVAQKLPAWEKEDKALELKHEAVMRMEEVVQWLKRALSHDPELKEARSLLAQIHFERHRDAEQRRAWDEAELHEIALRSYDIGTYRRYLSRQVPLTLSTTRTCKVTLQQYVRRGRRLLLQDRGELGSTPLIQRELPLGSYLVTLYPRGAHPVRYPVLLRRERGWDGQRAGAKQQMPLDLSPAMGLSEAEVFVPGGPVLSGGDPMAAGAGPLVESWVDSFVMKRDLVTFGEFAVFLTTPEGAHFRSGTLRDGLRLWRADWPAVGVSWEAACGYARWLSRRTGQRWRLPSEWEWEKAARGVDGRFFPWGDFADSAFCHVRTNEQPPSAPMHLSSHPTDCSPYGIVGMGGNVREWCIDPFVLEGDDQASRTSSLRSLSSRSELRVIRGGSWRLPIDASRSASRAALPSVEGAPDVGFRLARFP